MIVLNMELVCYKLSLTLFLQSLITSIANWFKICDRNKNCVKKRLSYLIASVHLYARFLFQYFERR